MWLSFIAHLTVRWDNTWSAPQGSYHLAKAPLWHDVQNPNCTATVEVVCIMLVTLISYPAKPDFASVNSENTKMFQCLACWCSCYFHVCDILLTGSDTVSCHVACTICAHHRRQSTLSPQASCWKISVSHLSRHSCAHLVFSCSAVHNWEVRIWFSAVCYLQFCCVCIEPGW